MSATLVSSAATLPDMARADSSACRASVRASTDWLPASWLWRASDSCMDETFCHSSTLTVRPTAATSQAATRPG